LKGRDSYIAFNNGGVYKDMHFITGGFERGGIPWKRRYRGRPIPVQGKMKHYNVDGSGRDTYIGYLMVGEKIDRIRVGLVYWINCTQRLVGRIL